MAMMATLSKLSNDYTTESEIFYGNQNKKNEHTHLFPLGFVLKPPGIAFF